MSNYDSKEDEGWLMFPLFVILLWVAIGVGIYSSKKEHEERMKLLEYAQTVPCVPVKITESGSLGIVLDCGTTYGERVIYYDTVTRSYLQKPQQKLMCDFSIDDSLLSCKEVRDANPEE